MAKRNRLHVNPGPSTSASYSTNQGYHFEDQSHPSMNGPRRTVPGTIPSQHSNRIQQAIIVRMDTTVNSSRVLGKLLISNDTPREYVVSETMSFLRRNEQSGYPVYLAFIQQEMSLDPGFNVFSFIQQEMNSSVRIRYSPNSTMYKFYLIF
ncbi:hypothetical protein B9Z55_027895 [Caenorhabditis nigoni]|uniref:Uncharacterized protein n=1 Tax=Caenorhabditis nigoni TaxID=1611254 RepID=A0A2G5SEG4_9PELO|nr:hypothetical protein B9Z55_027895 [Caenorhabditis nigoni]